MAIAIYREATSISKSTKTHLLIRQDYSNRTLLSENFGKDNILLTFNNGQVNQKILFNRTETSNKEHIKPVQDLDFKGFDRLNNDNLLNKYEELENQHFNQIKKYYEDRKIKEKAQIYASWVENGSLKSQKPKKMQTIYKGKPDTTHKEFLIAFGGSEVVNENKNALANLDNPEFYKKCVVAVKTQLLEMGLSDKNLVSILFHRDEKTPHLHIRYTNFDFENCQSLNTTIEKICNNDKKSIMQYRRNLLSKLQKTINNSFGFEFEPAPENKGIKHKTKREWLEQENQQLQAIQEQKQEQINTLNNKINDKNKDLENHNFLKFDFENLAKNNTYEEAKKKIEIIEEIGAKPINTDNTAQIKLFDLFILFIKKSLGIKYKEYQDNKKTYEEIKQEHKFIQPIITKTKQITR